jgi:hypothetical protein
MMSMSSTPNVAPSRRWTPGSAVTALRAAVIVGAALAWTLIGLGAWFMAGFSSQASNCDVAQPYVHPAEAAWAIGIAVVWPLPFVIWAVIRRTAHRTIIAVLAVGLSAYMATGFFQHPASWCLF